MGYHWRQAWTAYSKPLTPSPPSPGPTTEGEKEKRRSRAIWLGVGLTLFLGLPVVWYGALEGRLAAGRTFLNTGRYTEARQPYQQASTLCPICPEARLGLAIADLHDPTQAEAYEDHLKSLLVIAPNDPQVQIAAGRLAAFYRESERAIAHYRQAITSDPSAAEARYRLGIVYQQQGRLQEALARYTEALDLADPDPDPYLGQLASLYLELKDYEQADKTYQKLDSRFILGHQELALLRRLQGRLPEALDQQRQLVRLLNDPAVAGLPMNQDPWYFKTDRAQIEFHGLERKKTYAYYSLSTTFYLQSDEEAAREYLDKARALRDPKDEEVKEVVTYDLRRLATEQLRWKERSEDYWRRFLAPANKRAESTP